MPLKSNGRQRTSRRDDGEPGSSSETTRFATVTTRDRGKGKATDSRSVVPEVFHDLLAETLSSHNFDTSGAPRKKRKVRSSGGTHSVQDDEDDMSLEFENVYPSKAEQTAYNDSDDFDDSDMEWETVGQQSILAGKADDNEMVLTLNKDVMPRRKSVDVRRKAVTKAERILRLEIHKMNLLCLLRFVDQRNDWCNDKVVQETLKPLVTKKMLEYFRPKETNTQLGKTESVKKGLSLACDMWETKFAVAARGMRLPYWAVDENELLNFKISSDFDPPIDKNDFRLAAKKLEGSRDVGAQLFCALLRSAGLESRLICSLQPLPFTAATKVTPNRVNVSPSTARASTLEVVSGGETVDICSDESPFGIGGNDIPGMPFTPGRRLANPHPSNYFISEINSPTRPPKHKHKRKLIVESPYPVFWVEVLDEAHQKWMSVNPVDSVSISKPNYFEPPASDTDNNLSYVVAFEDEGTARDVTRRYTSSYNAKVRKNRVESTDGGERWWRRTLRFYSRGWKSDLDQIEDTELATKEAREPMPKSLADFKDHPTYALERHLRKNEVLVNPKVVGKVASGRDSNRKKLEKVYRRSDVKIVKSADGWYRIGREVKVGEQPVKIGARNADDENDAGTSFYTETQTEIYEAPPVVRGRIPKNSYGNLDMYVPSMVPNGGVHIPSLDASRAARLLGVDYADAVTGFDFRGRHGTAVFKGIVAATEYKEAIEAVLEGYQDDRARSEEEKRSVSALRSWKRFLVGLRIKERVDGYQLEGENEEIAQELSDEIPPNDDSGMESEEYFDDGGGGFFPD